MHSISQAVVVGHTIYVSGQLGLDPKTMNFAGDNVEAQTDQSLKNVKAILTAAGVGMGNVVKTTVLLADMNDFSKVNDIYGTCECLLACNDRLDLDFSKPYPARAAYQVACLPKNAKVEIEAVAVAGTISDSN